MNKNHTFITKDITFADLESGRVHPIDIYRVQVETSIFTPVKALKEAEYGSIPCFSGIAALSILLLFFENHGNYLNKMTGSNTSRKKFDDGFNRFISKAKPELVGDYDEVDDFYKHSRCGLYHNLKLGSQVLVSAYPSLRRQIFSKDPMAKDQILICPWRMNECLQGYLDSYCLEVKTYPQSELSLSFQNFFDEDIRSVLDA